MTGKYCYNERDTILRSKTTKASPTAVRCSRRLPLSSILSTFADRVAAALNTVSHALQTVANRLGSSGIVDRLANPTASCADDASGCLGEAASKISHLHQH